MYRTPNRPDNTGGRVNTAYDLSSAARLSAPYVESSAPTSPLVHDSQLLAASPSNRTFGSPENHLQHTCEGLISNGQGSAGVTSDSSESLRDSFTSPDTPAAYRSTRIGYSINSCQTDDVQSDSNVPTPAVFSGKREAFRRWILSLSQRWQGLPSEVKRAASNGSMPSSSTMAIDWQRLDCPDLSAKPQTLLAQSISYSNPLRPSTAMTLTTTALSRLPLR